MYCLGPMIPKSFVGAFMWLISLCFVRRPGTPGCYHVPTGTIIPRILFLCSGSVYSRFPWDSRYFGVAFKFYTLIRSHFVHCTGSMAESATANCGQWAECGLITMHDAQFRLQHLMETLSMGCYLYKSLLSVPAMCARR
jgi:hypothetical protein